MATATTTARGALSCPDHRDPAPHLARDAPASDDRVLEALLAEHRDPCTLQQLAGALEWTLERVLAAAERLEARLANTGQTLERRGHHTLALPRHRAYSWRWNNAASGNYTLTARAIDNEGAATTSAPMRISVRPR